MRRKQPWFKVILLFSVSLLAVPSYSYADAMGADLKLLSDMYQAMKKQLNKLETQVDQLKATNAAVKGVQSDMNDLNYEYHFVQNFNPNADVNDFKSWANSEVGLSGWKDSKSFDQKWSIINNELNKRFTKPSATPDYARNPQQKQIDALLKEMKKNEKQQLNYIKQAENHNNNISSKDLAKINASANAMSASVALEKKQKELEKEVARREVLLNQMQQDYSFVQYMGNH